MIVVLIIGEGNMESGTKKREIWREKEKEEERNMKRGERFIAIFLSHVRFKRIKSLVGG